MNYRNLTTKEHLAAEERGCYAENWSTIFVDESFTTDQLYGARFAGKVEIGRGVEIVDSYICNYTIGEGSTIESVTRLECRKSSSFGNGTSVATINECGGRAIKIITPLTAQTAYLWATARHRKGFVEALDSMAERFASAQESEMGTIGKGCTIIGARLIREMNIANEVTIEGSSLLENGTLLSGARVGIDVKARNFIAAENSTIDSGATLERCFVGESAIIANGFTAIDSLFFASSHCENGEAASIFAGPYTVSHHKSSLLIAGLFSFFNAGSGSNQSNHLFKCGPVHQAIHPRGCKFASGAYIMAPAIEGAYTMVKGYHAKHHDTSAFPFSYLIDDGARSVLMPGANLISYGTMRDTQKWIERDRRTLKRDNIDLKGENPYLTGLMLRAVNTMHTMQEAQADAQEYIHNRVSIKAAHMRRGLNIYNKAIVSALGAMLSEGAYSSEGLDGSGEWIDAAGQYTTLRSAEELMERVESGQAESFEQIAEHFNDFHQRYDGYAYSWAKSLLSTLIGHQATAEDIASAISSAESSREWITHQATTDRERDNSLSMAVGYGFDNHSDSTIQEADFRAVRSLY